MRRRGGAQEDRAASRTCSGLRVQRGCFAAEGIRVPMKSVLGWEPGRRALASMGRFAAAESRVPMKWKGGGFRDCGGR